MNATVAFVHQLNESAAEQRLFDFVAWLVLDLARTHPRVTDAQIAKWLARVVVGRK
jgi:hypothetical protein